MAEHAKTYYQQALSALAGGEPARAMDLLRRAKITVGGDQQLQARILTEMIRIAPQAGCVSESVVWDRQLTQLQAAVPPPHAPPEAGNAAHLHARRRIPWKWVALGTPTSAALVVLGVFLWNWSESRYRILDTPRTIENSSNNSKNSRLKWTRNIGLVVWLQRYESPASDGGKVRYEDLLGTGSAFAVTKSGFMLTNKHVTSINARNVPKERFSLTRSGGPLLRVCFGPDPKDHYVPKVVHESALYDLAILKVDREFEEPLELSYRDSSMTAQVLTCGFPGVVGDMASMWNRSHIETRIGDALRRTNSLELADYCPPDFFSPSSTIGIISATNREIEGPLYHMFDATVRPGNSGGPLLDAEDNRVIGIITLGIPGDVGYSFALALPQLRSELDRYIP